MEILSQPLLHSVEKARCQLDAHVREIVRWHFSADTGCPFWLEFADKLEFDPRKEIGVYDDLKLLGHFQDEWLRGGPVRRWVPKAYADEPVYVFETGGSTGIPKSRISVRDFQIDYEIYSETLSDSSFPLGSDWLMLGPTGPRRLRLAVEHLAQHRGGICFLVDLDPRWVNKLIKYGKHQELDAYKSHVIDQALNILRAHETIHCLFTTPKLLEALCEKISLKKAGIRGIFCGGTEMNAQFHRFAREELVPGIDFIPTYGNTLMGLACCKPFDLADNYAIIYYPPQPRAVIELVNPENTEESVDYGETGRVMLTTLTKEFFMPRFLERDEAERAKPIENYPWDGVENLRLFSELQESVVVGVY
jgi:phenylacetate-coenzyme A ligase PaaK-like adenylate-forming protein